MSITRIAGITPLLLATAWLNLATPGLSQDPEEAPEKSTNLTQDQGSKISIHAYATLAYGMTDGPPILGLDEDGTSEYRTAALQFRFTFTPRSELVMQLAHESLGDSPLDELQEEIELDWLFYQHRFPSQTRLRAGRLPIPFGIYNELRDVSTVLEFYRPPVSIYFEGTFASESVDGLALSHPFFSASPWSLDVDVYAGSWDRVEYAANIFTAAEGRAENGLGVQLWLNTPVDGLRFGLAAQRFDMEGGLSQYRTGGTDRFDTFLFSLDGDFSRFVFRAEAQIIKFSLPFASDVELPGFYVLGGYRATDRLAFYLQYEDSWSTARGGPAPPSRVDPFFGDLAAAVVYEFTPQVLLRLEAHRADTVIVDMAIPSMAPVRTDFAILSLAASF